MHESPAVDCWPKGPGAYYSALPSLDGGTFCPFSRLLRDEVKRLDETGHYPAISTSLRCLRYQANDSSFSFPPAKSKKRDFSSCPNTVSKLKLK